METAGCYGETEYLGNYYGERTLTRGEGRVGRYHEQFRKPQGGNLGADDQDSIWVYNSDEITPRGDQNWFKIKLKKP